MAASINTIAAAVVPTVRGRIRANGRSRVLHAAGRDRACARSSRSLRAARVGGGGGPGGPPDRAPPDPPGVGPPAPAPPARLLRTHVRDRAEDLCPGRVGRD